MPGASAIVSVVISTYNRRDKLKRAVTSALNQTVQEFELIVVDNASTDATEEMVKSIKDPRLRYIKHETNKGGPAARNTGIRAAQAPLIALLDDDDEWFAQKLEKQVQRIKQAPDKTGLVYAGTEIYDEHKRHVQQVNRPRYRGNVYHRLLLSTILGSVSSVLIKRECFDKAGLFDEQLTSCQDWDMWLRIAQYFEFDFVDETLARINMHGEQISTNFAALIPGRSRMVAKHEQEFKQHPEIFVVHLKRLGKLHFINGTWRQGFDWFKMAIVVRPLELVKILAWCVIELPIVKFCSPTKNFKKYTG
ncbi:MAG: glycosyltransferase family 2 protein [Candidatus Omnitrophica bacterium]|nr:glycosyltransferase family 2 protein [Candidatus Omnitrophota bacterium]